MDLAKKLKLLREINGLTQEELANKLHISRFAITNYENGNRTPDINVLVDICDFYDITLDSLFNDEVVIKPRKKLYKEKEKLLFIVTAIISVLIIAISSAVTRTYEYDYDISNDELKVINSSDISIVSFKEEIKNTNVYTLDYFKPLKGLDITYVEISNKNIEIKFNTYYLIFGNRKSTNKEYKNYISVDYLTIYSNTFLHELLDYNPEVSLNEQAGFSKNIIDYYTYFINKNDDTNIVYTDIVNYRSNKVIVKNKSIFDNKYDYLNLEEDFNIKFSDMEENHYKFIDIEISMKIDSSSSITPIVSLYSSLKDEVNYEIEVYKVNKTLLNDKYYKVITLHFKDINIEKFKYNNLNHELIVRYGYKSLFNSKWSNSNLSIRIGYKK